MSRTPRALGLLVLALAAAGCETVAWYSQAVLGQLKLVTARERVTAVIAADPESNLAARLETATALVDYAETDLALPPGRSYRTYVQLAGSSVVWNVFAAQPLSLEGRRWCYPFAGCAPYRGYFDREAALSAAARLNEQGFETFVGGVPAYSTLGWFDDSLLSSFIGWPDAELATLLFHELAHRRVWLPGDVRFNESYATFVADRGGARWFEAQGHPQVRSEFVERRAARARWQALLLAARGELEAIYASRAPRVDRLAARDEVYAALRTCYADRLDRYGGGAFDRAMAALNNAFLVSLATYNDLVPAFAALFEEVGGQWPIFHERVAELASQDDPVRARQLDELGEREVANGADQYDADQVDCEALARHRLSRNLAG